MTELHNAHKEVFATKEDTEFKQVETHLHTRYKTQQQLSRRKQGNGKSEHAEYVPSGIHAA